MKLIVAFRNFANAPKKWGFSDCAHTDQNAARRCQLCVMSCGLANSSRSLETSAVHGRYGGRVSVDGRCNTAEYKFQCRHFEFGTAYISLSMKTRLSAGRLGTQTSIPPKGVVLRSKVPHRSQVNYHIHKCPPPVPILSQLDPVHTPKFYFLRSILILSSHLVWVSQVVSFPQVSPPKPCIHFYSPRVCNVECLTFHSVW